MSPNDHFSLVPENARLAVHAPMSTAPFSSSARQPQEIGAICYNGSWPFRECKDGPPTRILSNRCNWVTSPSVRGQERSFLPHHRFNRRLAPRNHTGAIAIIDTIARIQPARGLVGGAGDKEVIGAGDHLV